MNNIRNVNKKCLPLQRGKEELDSLFQGKKEE